MPWLLHRPLIVGYHTRLGFDGATATVRQRNQQRITIMSTIIDQINAEQTQREVPDFSPGDTVVVNLWVREGERKRLQAFEGVVIARRNRGLHSAFTVRKISHGTGVERVFQTYSPLIDTIQIKRRGRVRRAKLFYLRNLEGKAARIREKLTPRASA